MQPRPSHHRDPTPPYPDLTASFQSLALAPDWTHHPSPASTHWQYTPHAPAQPAPAQPAPTQPAHSHLAQHPPPTLTHYQPPPPYHPSDDPVHQSPPRHPYQPDPPQHPHQPQPQPPPQPPHAQSAAPDPPSVLPTEAELSRRARAAAGLNVSAPEFVPSFAAHPAAPPAPAPPVEPVHPPPLQPANFDVFANVTDLLPPALAAPPPPHGPPDPAPPTSEQAVDAFERQFPALPSAAAPPGPAPRALAPQALGWDALQREQADLARADAHRRDLDAWHAVIDALVPDDDDDDDDDDDGRARLSSDVGRVWVSTGRSVAHLYEELRAEAAAHASVRNKFFDRAAAAFKRGDGAAAKRLSAQGRDANHRMKELHRRAADAIFEARNPPGVTDVIDLHGLHVSEAVDRLPHALDSAPAGKVRILTGTGHHTKGTGRARLRPAVKKWLQQSPFFFEEVVDANEYVGSFIVHVKR